MILLRTLCIWMLLLIISVISHMWSNFAHTKECQFPVATACPFSCLGKLPWETKLRSFSCLESEQGNWIAVLHQVTAFLWVTLSLFRNISSEWNRHSSRQLSAFPNCLCPCVDCEDVIFLTPWVWLTHHMTVPGAHAQAFLLQKTIGSGISEAEGPFEIELNASFSPEETDV